MMDFLDILDQDGFNIRRVSTREWACECPKCGGDDRLRIWPEQDECGYAWCRYDDWRGDAIQYLRDYRRYSFKEACRFLGCEEKLNGGHSKKNGRKKQRSREKKGPNAQWMEMAGKLVEYAENELWGTTAGKKALEWLKNERHLSEETIKKARLGFLPSDYYRDPETWGLSVEMDRDGQKKDLWVPGNGIVIPKFDGDDVVRIRTRRLKRDNGPKYAVVRGSDMEPMWVQKRKGKAVLFLESELDAWLIDQEAGDIVDAVGLGSATSRPGTAMADEIRRRSLVMSGLDSDEAGVTQSWTWWRKHFSNFSRAPLPRKYGTDPCEAMHAGLDLSQWVQACIRLSGGLDSEQILKKYGVECHYIASENEAEKATMALQERNGFFGLELKVIKGDEHNDHPLAGIDPALSKVRLMAVFDGHSSVYVFDLFSFDINVVLLLFQGNKFVAHSAIFAMKHLMAAGAMIDNFDCTELAANALRNERYSLDYLVETCLKIRRKENGSTNDLPPKELTHDQITTSACNAVLSVFLYESLEPMLYEHYKKKIYDLMRNAQKAIVRLELNGIGFDSESHHDMIQGWQVALEKAEVDVREIVGDDINLNSGQEIAKWMEENLEDNVLDLIPRTSKGHVSTSADALAKMGSHDFVTHLLAFRHYKKLLSTFGESYAKFIIPATGRIHSNFMLAASSTGRTPSHSPNIQNPPRDSSFRALFTAAKGYVLLVADFSQIQLRIVAILSGDRNMLNGYGNGEDLHSLTATAITGIAVDDIDKEQRQLAKAANFGSLFGQGVTAFKAKAEADYGISMTDAEARRIRDAFFDNYPGLEAWQEKTAQDAEWDQSVTTPSGRVRDFTREPGGYSYSEALCTPVQGGEAEVLLAVLGLQSQYMEGLDAKLVNIIHDELVFEVAEKDVDKALVAVEELMIAGMLKIFPNASTVGLVEANVGKTWADAK